MILAQYMAMIIAIESIKLTILC